MVCREVMPPLKRCLVRLRNGTHAAKILVITCLCNALNLFFLFLVYSLYVATLTLQEIWFFTNTKYMWEKAYNALLVFFTYT
ncbi:hypothetical protein Hdeb2414_s0003g00109621 [Helianthus debilis subsp. tardiflorus]